MSAIFQCLTAAQRAAVEHIEGPLLILAGPGSGKTRVITHRVANLLEHGVHPSQILALTFTNKAANEMRERVQRLVPDAPVWMSTFHRFCSRLLRRYASHVGLESNFTIYDTSDSLQALKRALEAAQVSLTMTTPSRVANRISWLKNRLITHDDYEPRLGDELGAIIQDVYPAYQRELLAANAVDFDDLLLHVVTLLAQSPDLRSVLDETYRYVMVDEYQDTNLAQYTIVRGLCQDYPNLAVTGDPDQSIYGWRGANLDNILDFESNYPEVRVVRLEQNYRSTPNILRVAETLISNNQRRKHKSLFTENPEGPPVRIVTYESHKDEADDIVASMAREVHAGRRRPRDFAVFYRINALSRTFEHALTEHRIPYQIVHGVEFYQRKEIKDLVAFLQLIHNPSDNNALSRIINVPPRRIGKATVVQLADYARTHAISMLQAVQDCERISTLPKASRPRLRAFAELIDKFSRHASDPLAKLMDLVVTDTGYLSELRASDAPEDAERAANVEELLAAAAEFDQQNAEPDALGAFLEQASLVNDIDDWDDQTDRVTLMTLHAAKGLEFPIVFIIGVEEGLLPHERSRDRPDEEEEERRLLFVGITRAKQELQLSRAAVRAHRGGLVNTIPSPFLVELPRGEMEVSDRSQLSRRGWSDESWPTVDMPPLPTSPNAAGGQRPGARPEATVNLQTAAQLLGATSDSETEAHGDFADEADFPLIDPASYQIGMTVIHPEYGLGKIAALSGQGKGRTGTINFVTVGQRRFVLAKAKLRRAK